jgi:hypothetical protein
MNASRQAELAGFDLSLVAESLRRTPEQRAVQHQQALLLALGFERAGRQLHERTQQTAATTHRR